MEAVVLVLMVLSYIAALVAGAASRYGNLYDRLYQHSGNFPAVGGP
jgi:hypothetical protein